MIIDDTFNLILKSNDWSFAETSSYSIYVKGHCFYNGNYYDGNAILDPFCTILEEVNHVINDILNELNGSWAAIIYHKKTREIQLISDRYRSIPLFYAVKDNAVTISDYSHGIEDVMPHTEIDTTSELQFLLSGFVTGDKTLFKDIHQVEPGTYVSILENKEVSYKQYFTFFPELKEIEPINFLEVELRSIIYRIKDRLEIVCKNKKVFVPLSGGNDSRLIMWMLSESGIKDVVCYTYGVSDNPQRKIAQQIAEGLGYDWHL
jgi:asparagine synthase (glutamine-hydrolysing)